MRSGAARRACDIQGDGRCGLEKPQDDVEEIDGERLQLSGSSCQSTHSKRKPCDQV